jgi:hypothetical protein
MKLTPGYAKLVWAGFSPAAAKRLANFGHNLMLLTAMQTCYTRGEAEGYENGYGAGFHAASQMWRL